MPRMSVVQGELEGSRLEYRDFVIAGRTRAELFSARLVEGSGVLQVTWTASLGRGTLVNRLRQVQALAGGPGRLTRIVGLATDNLELLVRSRRFPTQHAAAMLEEKLGGSWRVVVNPRPKGESWQVEAIRVGD